MRNSKFNIRKVMLCIADAAIIAVCGILANFILSALGLKTGYVSMVDTPYVVVSTCINVIFTVISLWIFGAYHKVWRFFNARDYLSCVAGVAAGMVVSTCVLSLRYSVFDFVLPYTILTAIGAVIGVALFRFCFKTAFIKISDASAAEGMEKTLIIGCGNAGKMILNDIKTAMNDEHNESRKLNPVGFVDDDIIKQNINVDGLRVLGTTYDIPSICERENVSLIIFAIPSCDEEDRTRILEICSKTETKIKIVPYISQILFEEGQEPQLLNQTKEIKIEDLLGREPITFDKKSVRTLVKGKICMVTGGGGSIGSELVRQIAKYSPEKIIIVDIYENNAYDIQQELVLEYGEKLNLSTVIASVRDYDKMEQIFKTYRPELVWHAAAHKHVPLMETVPGEACSPYGNSAGGSC